MSKVRKVFIHEDGSVSTIEAPEGSNLRVEGPTGETVEQVVTSDKDWSRFCSLAEQGEKLGKNELKDIIATAKQKGKNGHSS